MSYKPAVSCQMFRRTVISVSVFIFVSVSVLVSVSMSVTFKQFIKSHCSEKFFSREHFFEEIIMSQGRFLLIKDIYLFSVPIVIVVLVVTYSYNSVCIYPSVSPFFPSLSSLCLHSFPFFVYLTFTLSIYYSWNCVFFCFFVFFCYVFHHIALYRIVLYCVLLNTALLYTIFCFILFICIVLYGFVLYYNMIY